MLGAQLCNIWFDVMLTYILKTWADTEAEEAGLPPYPVAPLATVAVVTAAAVLPFAAVAAVTAYLQ